MTRISAGAPHAIGALMARYKRPPQFVGMASTG
jgi:hypothetical protein